MAEEPSNLMNALVAGYLDTLDHSSDNGTEAVQEAKVSVNEPALKKVKEDSSSEESSEKPKPVVKPTTKQKATESSSG